MKMTFSFILCITLLPYLMTAPVYEGGSEIEGSKSDAKTCQISEMMNGFAFNTQKQLSQSNADNMIFSPYSIFEALAMLNAAAKGRTKEEIKAALNSGQSKNFLSLLDTFRDNVINKAGNGASIGVANKAWIDNNMKVLKSFNENLKEYFNADIGSQPFASNKESARKSMNDWVENKTDHMIKNLFPSGSIDSLTKLVLANAIYFKGSWEKPFNPNHTREDTFFSVDGNSIEGVEYMYKNDEYISHVERNVQLIELPYEGESFSMIIAMPMEAGIELYSETDENGDDDESKIENIEELSKRITLEMFNEWSNKLSKSSSNKEEADLYMPKFGVKQSIDLTKPMKALGIREVFDMRNADLSGITGNKDLYCSTAIHKAYLKVDETGTSAGASTGLLMKPMSLPPQIRLDRPFLFFVVRKPCNSIIFSGKLVNPLS